MLGASRIERLAGGRRLSERWAAHPEAVRETLRAWLSWWRDVVLLQLGRADRIRIEMRAMQAVADQVDALSMRETAASLQQALADLDMNVNARLVLDLLLLRLPRARLA